MLEYTDVFMRFLIKLGYPDAYRFLIKLGYSDAYYDPCKEIREKVSKSELFHDFLGTIKIGLKQGYWLGSPKCLSSEVFRCFMCI